jgi:parallel beta-helix repeat protein
VLWRRPAGSGSTVSDNTAYQNGSHGIQAEGGSTVQGNTMRQNNGYGLLVFVDVGYRGNVISSNTSGTVTGGFNAGGNVCNGSLTCP